MNLRLYKTGSDNKKDNKMRITKGGQHDFTSFKSGKNI